jgi:hypothetical protein
MILQALPIVLHGKHGRAVLRRAVTMTAHLIVLCILPTCCRIDGDMTISVAADSSGSSAVVRCIADEAKLDAAPPLAATSGPWAGVQYITAGTSIRRNCWNQTASALGDMGSASEGVSQEQMLPCSGVTQEWLLLPMPTLLL